LTSTTLVWTLHGYREEAAHFAAVGNTFEQPGAGSSNDRWSSNDKEDSSVDVEDQDEAGDVHPMRKKTTRSGTKTKLTSRRGTTTMTTTKSTRSGSGRETASLARWSTCA
jgi:hypothetical protein